MSAGHPTAAIGMEFDAIAAVIVGGTSFERGKGSLGGTLIGVLFVGSRDSLRRYYTRGGALLGRDRQTSAARRTKAPAPRASNGEV